MGKLFAVQGKLPDDDIMIMMGDLNAKEGSQMR